jgi:hypothetical protein
MFPEPREEPIRHVIKPISFAIPIESGKQNGQLSAKARAIIGTIVRYTESSPRTFLFGQCCNLNVAETYELLRTSKDDRSAFEAAILLKGPPPTPEQKLAKLISAIHQNNPAIGLEPSLESFKASEFAAQERDLSKEANQVSDDARKALAPLLGGAPPAPGGTLTPTPNPGGGGSPGGQLISSSYDGFRSTRYPSTAPTGTQGGGGRVGGSGGGGWTYTRMITRSVGFGGVIFGNEIASDLPGPVSVSWLPSLTKAPSRTSPGVTDNWGRLAFQMKDGSILLSKTVRADTVLSAKSLAFSTRQSLGEGVGLVGYIGRFYAGALTSEGKLEPKGFGFSYVVHPDIAATRVGRSMMMLDSFPMAGDLLYRQISKSNAQAGEQLKSILSKALGQYKFTDVKLNIVKSIDGGVTVERQSKDYPSVSTDKRSQSFITLRSFDGESPRAETALPIYVLMPSLIAISDPFARANEFAEVFALLRWAAKSGTWVGSPPNAEDLRPVSAVVIDEKDSIAFGSSEPAFAQSVLNQVYDRAIQIAKTSGNPTLEDTTVKLKSRLSNFVSLAYAIKIAGSAADSIETTFPTNAALAREFPELAERLRKINSSRRRELQDSLKDSVVRDWEVEHLDELDRRVPGLKARVDAEVKLASEIDFFKKFISDRTVLLVALATGSRSDEISKIRREMAAAGSTEAKLKLIPRLVEASERAVPQFAPWYELEQKSIALLLAPYLSIKDGE